LGNKSPVFISYSREDSEFVKRLISDLKAAGANVWLDQIDIRPGSRWDREVEQALTNCTELIVVITAASVKSDQVMDEISFALDERKTIIPVINGECAMPFRLRRLQHVDFRSDYANSLGSLLKSLLINQQVERTSVDALSARVADSPDPTALIATPASSDVAAQDRDKLSFLNHLTSDKGLPFLAKPFLLADEFVCASNGHALFAVRLRESCPIKADPAPEQLSQRVREWLRSDSSGATALTVVELNDFAEAAGQADGNDPVQIAGVIVDLRMLRPYIEHLNVDIVRVWGTVTSQFADIPTMLTIDGGDRIVVAMGLKPDTIGNYRIFTPRAASREN
jgi:TIR domain